MAEIQTQASVGMDGMGTEPLSSHKEPSPPLPGKRQGQQEATQAEVRCWPGPQLPWAPLQISVPLGFKGLPGFAQPSHHDILAKDGGPLP